MKLINVGYNNMVNFDRVVAVVSSDAAPSKRLVAEARAAGRAIDCTSGRKTRSVVIMDSDHIVLSAIQNETISGRLNGAPEDGGEGDSLADAMDN